MVARPGEGGNQLLRRLGFALQLAADRWREEHLIGPQRHPQAKPSPCTWLVNSPAEEQPTTPFGRQAHRRRQENCMFVGAGGERDDRVGRAPTRRP